MLIDIQAKMAEGKTVGYEKWAKKFNRKEAARTVILLKEKGVDSYEDLVALTDKLTSRFSELSDSIKAAEKRMVEIGALQTHINNYSKTRKTYEAYRKSGYSKKFFEEHRDELMLHKAAKQAFDQLDGQKVPSRQALHEEFNRLLVEKKQASRHRAAGPLPDIPDDRQLRSAAVHAADLRGTRERSTPRRGSGRAK